MCHRKQNIEKCKLCVRPTVRFDFSARKDNTILNTVTCYAEHARAKGSFYSFVPYCLSAVKVVHQTSFQFSERWHPFHALKTNNLNMATAWLNPIFRAAGWERPPMFDGPQKNDIGRWTNILFLGTMV